mgnify:FL=1
MKNPMLAAAFIALAACSGKDAARQEPPTGAEVIQAVKDARSLPPEMYVGTTIGANLELPGVWKGRYTTLERTDTTAGAKFAVEFRFRPDSGSKAPALTLMTLRVFTVAAWNVASARPGRPVGAKVGETAKDVFVLSLPESNPYPPATPEAPEYDKLLIAIAQGGQHVRLIAR